MVWNWTRLRIGPFSASGKASSTSCAPSSYEEVSLKLTLPHYEVHTSLFSAAKKSNPEWPVIWQMNRRWNMLVGMSQRILAVYI